MKSNVIDCLVSSIFLLILFMLATISVQLILVNFFLSWQCVLASDGALFCSNRCILLSKVSLYRQLHWSRSADSTVAEQIHERSLLLVYSSRSSNNSERSRIRSATVESAERDQCFSTGAFTSNVLKGKIIQI